MGYCVSECGKRYVLRSNRIEREEMLNFLIFGPSQYDAASRLYTALEANAVLTRNDYFIRDEEEPMAADRDVR